MKTITATELKEILRLHLLWLDKDPAGSRADLSYADLQGVDLRRANLEGANLEGAALQGVNLQYANLQGAKLKGANLQGATLRGADLHGVDLGGANLEGAALQGASLKYADLERANLKGANLRYADLKCANLQHANLKGANLEGVDLKDVDLEGANLECVALFRSRGNGKEVKETYFNPYPIVYTKDILQIGCEGHSFEEWKEFSDEEIEGMDESALDFWIENKERCLALQGRDELSCNEVTTERPSVMKTITAIELEEILRLHLLWLDKDPAGSRADLRCVNLKGVDLQYADLRHVRLQGVGLEDANLQGANLQGVNLQHANLQGADLRHANLQGANLTYSIFIHADLRNTDLRHTELAASDFTGVDLAGAKLQFCHGNGKEIRDTYLVPYEIVYTKDMLFIGCEGHSFEEWKEFSDTRIDDMELGRSLDFWIENRDRCLALQEEMN